MTLIGYDGDENVGGYLKVTDMFLNTSYILCIIGVIAIILSPLSKRISSKKEKMKNKEKYKKSTRAQWPTFFLLLVFFLVSTSMATDEGLSRQLPPPIRKEQKIEKVDIKPRNIMTILVNSNDELMVNGNVISLNELKEKAKRVYC